MNEAHKPEFKNALLDQLDSLSVLCLISFKIHIMFLMGENCCKDFQGLLEARFMKYVNASKNICWTTIAQLKT